MHMIRHDHISTDCNIMIVISSLNKTNKSVMSCVIGKQLLAIVSTKGDEIDWGRGVDIT